VPHCRALPTKAFTLKRLTLGAAKEFFLMQICINHSRIASGGLRYHASRSNRLRNWGTPDQHPAIIPVAEGAAGKSYWRLA
jgi:hypothetical protein